MNATGLLLTIGGMIPGLVILIGCIVFAARARSCASWGLAFAAIGQFVMAVVLSLYNVFGVRMLLESENPQLVYPLGIAVNALSTLAALLFAVFLLVVLFGKLRAPRVATVPQQTPPMQPPSPPGG
jgi:chromate transport protein ChrA